MTLLSPKSLNYLEIAKKSLKEKGLPKDLLSSFENEGIPGKKNEDYKYTNLEASLHDEIALSHDDPSPEVLEKIINEVSHLPGENKLVFYNGKYLKDAGVLKDSLQINDKKSIFKKDPIVQDTEDPLTSLNLSMLRHSYELVFPKNSKSSLTTLFQFVDQNEKESSFNHLTLIAEEGAQASILEILKENNKESSISSQSFGHSALFLSKNSNIQHAKLYLCSTKHNHVGKFYSELKRDAQLNSLSFLAKGKVIRHNMEVNLVEEGAHATVNGLYTGRESQHPDSFTHIHHIAPHTTSNQLFKGILDDNAHGIFTGKIVVHRDAQKVDSSQLNKNLILSKKAHVDTRPQIEVYADDVKCGHGATVGQINDEEVFYLQSRGIQKAKAQKILCHAFGQEVIDSFNVKEVCLYLEEILYKEFEKYALENIEND